MEKTTPVKVLNRDNGSVIYSIPEMNGLRRVFQAGETKQVTYEELQKLSYIPGGKELLTDSLVILNQPKIIEELLGKVEPEYSYTKEDVKKLMLNGSLDEFLDCLDFSPAGVIDIIKSLAVELPLNDVAKREAIYNKTGFNVDNAIRIQKESVEPTKEEPVTQRRVQKTQVKSPITTRRVVTTSVKKED